MADIGRLRRAISSLLLWGIFFCLYVGGAAVLALGLIFTVNTWWAVMDQHAGRWTIFVKTGEVLFLAAGLLLILIIPFLQLRGLRKLTRRNEERRSDIQRKASPSA
ncbi:MAG TPA: hypothetical protein VMV34_00170 [Terriglobia bacterium]|nr:hypothetical protein [Terriglobia bacterium]